MTDKLILSASSISEYLSCRRKYLFSSVYRLEGTRSLAAALGSAVHDAVEGFWTSPLRPLGRLRTAFTRETASVPAGEMNADPGALQDGERMLGVFMAQVAPRFRPSMVEQGFLIAVDEVPGVLVSGTIDAATDDGQVRDLKTTDLISRFRPHAYHTQLNLYGFGYRAMTGRPAKRLVLDVLTRRGQVPYREIEVPIDEPGTIDVLGVVRDAIISGDYGPTGADSGACKWCPYSEICPYARLD